MLHVVSFTSNEARELTEEEALEVAKIIQEAEEFFSGNRLCGNGGGC